MGLTDRRGRPAVTGWPLAGPAFVLTTLAALVVAAARSACVRRGAASTRSMLTSTPTATASALPAEGPRRRRIAGRARPLLSIPPARYGVAVAALLVLIVWIT
jgi:hypothetical protein